jgi:hypothetical protein
MKERLPFPMSRFGIILLVATGIAMIAGTRGLRGDEDLPVADGKPATGVLPADVQASQVAFETATFGLG